jgi:hypothetical protein
MILPSKHLRQDRSLLSVGAVILRRLRDDSTVSSLWNDLRLGEKSGNASSQSDITFDWFILALDFLYIAGTIDLNGGVIRRVGS